MSRSSSFLLPSRILVSPTTFLVLSLEFGIFFLHPFHLPDEKRSKSQELDLFLAVQFEQTFQHFFPLLLDLHKDLPIPFINLIISLTIFKPFPDNFDQFRPFRPNIFIIPNGYIDSQYIIAILIIKIKVHKD